MVEVELLVTPATYQSGQGPVQEDDDRTTTKTRGKFILDPSVDSWLCQGFKMYRDSGSTFDFDFDGTKHGWPVDVLMTIPGQKSLKVALDVDWCLRLKPKYDDFTMQCLNLCHEVMRHQAKNDLLTTRQDLEWCLVEHLKIFTRNVCTEGAQSGQLQSKL